MLQEYYKELEVKSKKLKAANLRKRNIQERHWKNNCPRMPLP